MGTEGTRGWKASKEKGHSAVKYHIDSHTALLLDHYSEVVATNDLFWSRA